MAALVKLCRPDGKVMTMRRPSMLVAIGGGSGSGKTTLARRIVDTVGEQVAALVEIDSYYLDSSQVPEAQELNFDHPDAIDWELLLSSLMELREGRAIEQPMYEFGTHARGDSAMVVEPRPVVVIEGIHALSEPGLRDLCDFLIYVDTDPDIRFIRRLRRDILNRDRSIDSVVAQYQETVRPMHVDHVEPSRRHADIILPEGSCNELGIDLLIEALSARLLRFAETWEQ